MISIVTFANLGTKKNLKTPDIEPVIRAFAAHREPARIICQIDAHSPYPQTVQAMPKALRYALRLLEKISGGYFSRRTHEHLVDWCAARRLKASDMTLLHGGYTFPRTARRARSLGSVTIDLAVSANIATNAELEARECAMLGIDAEHACYPSLERELGNGIVSDYLIAMSEFVKQTYVAHGFPEGHIFVAPPDIDTVRFAPQSEKTAHPFRVLYVADTQPLKGLHYLLDAWEALRLPDAELWIAGQSAVPRALEERYAARIRALVGVRRIPHTHEVERLYAQASVLAFPSLTEGFGRVTLEAMACGIPVITTENARGIVEDGVSGFVVPIRDAGALAEKIRYVYDHHDVTLTMGKAARKAVEAKKPFGEAVYEICRDIIHGK